MLLPVLPQLQVTPVLGSDGNPTGVYQHQPMEPTKGWS